MPLRLQTLVLLAILAMVSVYALGVLIEAAGKTVAVAVAIAALGALVISYLGTGVLIARGLRDQRARERLRRWGRAPIAIMLVTPLLLIAAHPWGVATLVVGLGAMLACQLGLQAVMVAVAIRHRRAGTETSR